MKTTLIAGLSETRSIVIDQARTIGFMGEELRVYATPSMVHDVELLCRDLLMHHAGEQEDSVGARVEIDHLAPTLLGQTVTLRATVQEVQLPKVIFQVEVADELDTVGRAIHVRFVVDTLRQGERLQKKTRRWKERQAAGPTSA